MKSSTPAFLLLNRVRLSRARVLARLRKAVIGLVLLSGAAGVVQSAPAEGRRMDPEERQRLRQELRQQWHHQDRDREMRQERRERLGLRPQGPAPNMEGASPDAGQGPGPGPGARLPPEERRELRRQLREQYQARQAGQQ